MFGFLIKKAFFDMWDNLFRIVIVNLGFIAVAALLLYFPLLFKSLPLLFYAALIIGLLLLSVYTGAASRFVRDIANYQAPSFREFWEYVKVTYPSSLLFAITNIVFIFLLSIAFPVYGHIKSIVGPIAFSLLFWLTVTWILSSQYFFPVQSQLDLRFKKILKKMFLIFLDNLGFSIALAIGGLVIIVISVFTAFLLPGPAALLLWVNVALKLRLYKYDYLEENPGANKKAIPWDALLIEDREKVGKRTLKGMIFPWKE